MKSVKNRDILLSKIETNLIKNANYFNSTDFEPNLWQISHSGSFSQQSFLTTTTASEKNRRIIGSPIENQGPVENFMTELQNEYIQIDIWTNGSLSPRQSLLNAFKKLFEIFDSLSKNNFIKPIGFGKNSVLEKNIPPDFQRKWRSLRE